MNLVEIPSKTFLLGEYGVLYGGPALVLCHPPFFEIDQERVRLHPKSPAGKWLQKEGVELNLPFKDPYKGGGGFGGSTAELVGAYYYSNKRKQTEKDLMAFYYALYKEEKEPSGADLYTQLSLEEGLFEFTKSPLKKNKLEWPFKEISIFLLKRKVKVKTHEHLQHLNAHSNFSLLQSWSLKGIEALKNKDWTEFIFSEKSFSKAQNKVGLLDLGTLEICNNFELLEGVECARGCGAKGADVLALFVKKDRVDYIKRSLESKKDQVEFIRVFN